MIRNIILLTAATLRVCVLTAPAQLSAADTVDVINNSISGINSIDSINGIDTVGIAGESVDTVNVNTAKSADKDVIDLDDAELLQAVLAADSVKAPPVQKLDLIRREHEYKKQTRAAIVMMIFIAAAMATSQSLNPR